LPRGHSFFTEIEIGNYILWSGYPGFRPFIDGRNLYPERIERLMSVLKKPEQSWPAFEKEYSPLIVMAWLDRDTFVFLNYLNTSPEWVLILSEGRTVVYVKRGAFASASK
jgi:hypothetical protein